MKRKLASLVIAIGLVVCNSLSTGVFARETSPVPSSRVIQPRIGCSVCNYEKTALLCNKSKYYSYDYPHQTNGITCTVIVYESSYKGRFCMRCNAESNIPFDYSSRHLCTERHSSCGLGTIDRPECLHEETGTVMPEI